MQYYWRPRASCSSLLLQQFEELASRKRRGDGAGVLKGAYRKVAGLEKDRCEQSPEGPKGTVPEGGCTLIRLASFVTKSHCVYMGVP